MSEATQIDTKGLWHLQGNWAPVFDEVDANIGGQTAAVVGAKLRELGDSRQVLCITHFAQVAACAHRHFQIAKGEREGRTVTSVLCLQEYERSQEYLRMLGGADQLRSIESSGLLAGQGAGE